MRTTTYSLLPHAWHLQAYAPSRDKELTPLDRTPAYLKSMYYDVNGDGKMEYLGTKNDQGVRYTAWFALDGTEIERVQMTCLPSTISSN